MANSSERAVVFENPAMQLDDEVIPPQRETETHSHPVIGQDSSTYQSSSPTHQGRGAEPPSPLLIRRNIGRRQSPSGAGLSDSNGGPVQLLSVSELRDKPPLPRYGDNKELQQALAEFVSKKQGSGLKHYKSREVRSYYRRQDRLIAAFEDLSRLDASENSSEDHANTTKRLASLFSKITLVVNVMLMSAKLVASVQSSSMSIISSLVDSAMDLLSGAIMWWAARAIQTRNPYQYPQGRTKLEPVSIVILSVVMSLASVQILRESVEKIALLVNDPTALPTMGPTTFIIAGTTIVVKFILWLTCRPVASPIVQALAMDHRNDVMSNSVAIICGYLGSRNFQAKAQLTGFIYTDPIGAILISCYIMYNWWKTGSEQIRLLTGHTASQDFLSQLTWIAMHHDPRITHIDTVAAYHYGNNFLVKVDIVLPETMSLRDAHDIGEALQRKLERIPEVERAFVHVDYEYCHKPSSEHKII